MFLPSSIFSLGFLAGSDNGTTVPVLVAKRYIAAFSVIKPDDVEMRRYPQTFVPPGVLNNPSELETDAGQSVYASVVAIPDGQPLTRAVLIDAGQKQRMASLIHPGRVAVSFAVDKSHAAGGWVRPGDTIAIFETLPLPPGPAANAERSTKILFSALQVLAVDNVRVGQGAPDDKDADKSALMVDLSTEDASTRILTVLATGGQAATLLDAREKGALSVVLRALGDDVPWPGDPAFR